MALARDNVWLDLAGLPPKRLPDYYAAFDLTELARKWIFGTDWPGVHGVASNVRAMVALGLPRRHPDGVLSGNADRALTLPEHDPVPGPGLAEQARRLLQAPGLVARANS